MKAHISSTIKAHLIRGAFYLLLLLAVSLIPFALAQRTTAKGNRPATTITVTNTNDSGPGSLRQALADANNGDTINFAVTGTIGLTSGELLVDHSITISGPSAKTLGVNGNNQSRVFHIASGRTVTISGLTIIDGHTAEFGGGIYNDHAVLMLSNCVITGNSAALNIGGGIHNDGTNIGHATLEINNSLITNNSGGGIYNDAIQAGTATLVITYSTLSNNNGDAINNDGWSCMFCGNGTTSVQIINSSITGNPGRAIYSDTGRLNCGGECPITVSITNSTISGNGGGVYNSTLSDALVSNSTISDNGTGISNNLGALGSSVFNSTMSNNGVEIRISAGSGSLATMGNTIFKVSPGGHSIVNDSGTVMSYGYNVSSDDGGGYLNGAGDQINTEPLLGPLQDNGGPTFTHTLLVGSPAINSGDPNFTPPPLYDQRGPGFDRLVNGRIDKGSFEVQAGTTPTPTPTCIPGGTPGPWTQANVYPLSVSGAAVASNGTSIYAFGGNTNGSAHAEAYRYDPSANTWTALASMPTGPDYLCHAEYGGDGKIYVMGGSNGGTLNRIYDIATNNWSAGAPVPEEVYDHGHAYWNGKIYVIGGIVFGVAWNAVYAYDVATNTWSAPLSNLPQAEFDMACGAINNKIYCANGSTSTQQGHAHNELFIYDIAVNSWTTGANSPLASIYPAGTVVGGKLYMIGGFDTEAFNNTYLYDPVTNSWTAGPGLNAARGFADAATVNTAGGETAVVVAGTSDQGALNSVERSTLQGCATPTPTPTATATATPTATATATATTTPTATATHTPTATPTSTPTATATLTPRPTPTPRPALTPRPRPTPPPRP